MIQEIITYIILLAALAYLVYSLIKMLRKPKDASICGNCSERKSSCSLEQLKKEIAENKIPPRKNSKLTT